MSLTYKITTYEDAIELIRANKQKFYVEKCALKGKNIPLARKFKLYFTSEPIRSEQNVQVFSQDEALDLVKKAHMQYLVGRTFANQAGDVLGLCFCKQARCDQAAYPQTWICLVGAKVAVIDHDVCQVCGNCVATCYFGARKVLPDRLELDQNACQGCGLCVEACVNEAVSLVERED